MNSIPANAPVAMMIDNPHGSQQLYEQLVDTLSLSCSAGGILHVAGPSPAGGWRVIELWPSVEEAGQFLSERFGPALRQAGTQGPPPQPEFWPVHRFLA